MGQSYVHRLMWGLTLVHEMVPYRMPYILLVNVEHCGGEPEQADRILISDVTYSTFGAQCKLTQWNHH